LITPHKIYWSIDECVEQVQYRYRELFKVMILDVDIHKIPDATTKNYPLGDERFKQQLARTLKRKLGSGSKGRPRKIDG
jgi:hypothetical protein